MSENETLRWPTNLDRQAIEQRLRSVRELATRNNASHIVALFEGLERMSSAQLGSTVIAALTAVQEKPEHAAIASALEMVALNLKNLKAGG
jgi:hypothetical protein